ncbi:MAG: hypothetical protein J6J45_03355 [Clostridia bacterium]|nr:hypothetical protein [Clostridia bacterium]
MNDFCKLFLNIDDGETLTLEKDRIYHVRQDDSVEKRGIYCSNTAKQHENPDGYRCAAMFLQNKKNITVEGNGATVIVHGKMTPMLFDRCENITVRNLCFDYACPTMSEFTVIADEGESFVIKINGDCLFDVEENSILWHGEQSADGTYFWADRCNGNRRHIKVFNPETKTTKDFNRNYMVFDRIERIDENTLRLYPADKSVKFEEGCVYQTRNIVRDATGSLFQRCKNLTFDNIRMTFMHGLGMVSQFCENVTYLNCDFTPKAGRTVASTADFFQFSGCKGKITVENCKAGGAHDDYINVHGTHLRIVEADGNSMVVRFMHDESWGFQAFENGDELEFIRWDTLAPYAQTKVVSFERLNDTDIILVVDRPVPSEAVIGKDVVENATWTPDLHVSGCEFGPTSGRGILCTTRGEVVIENNRFDHLWGPALLLEDDCNFWFESGYTKQVVFRNNTVTACEFGKTWSDSPVIRYSPKVMNEQSTHFVHGKLVVFGNTFEKPYEGNHSFCLEYLAEAEITDNVFDADYKINAKCVGKVTDSNNLIRK